MSTKSGFRDWLGHTSTKVAIALTIFGFLFVLIELQSPSRLYLTGQSVQGTDRAGIVYYEVKGQQYTQDDEHHAFASGSTVTVYFDPDDPSGALLPSPSRWVDAASVLVWFVGAAVLLGASALRRRSTPPPVPARWP